MGRDRPEIEVQIDRLILKGLRPSERRRLQAALEDRLQDWFSQHAEQLAGGRSSMRLDGITVLLGGDTISDEVGQIVHQVCSSLADDRFMPPR